MELKNKLYGEYIDSVVSKLKGKGLQNETRDALYKMLEEYYAVAIENKASHEEAVHSAIVNMGDAAELVASIKEQHKDHLAIGVTIALASVVVGFFAVMIPVSHGEIIQLYATSEVAIVVGLSLALAIVLSVYRFTLYKFLCRLEFSACVTGIGYAFYRCLVFYGTKSEEVLKRAENVRADITQMILVLIYAIALYTVANAIKRRGFPPSVSYIRNIFVERDHLRVKGRFGGRLKKTK